MEDKLKKDLEFLSFDPLNCLLTVKKGLVPGMRVEGRVWVSEILYKQLLDELEHYHRNENKSYFPAIYQIGNVAGLPGICGYSFGLPDIHTGYGFAIGHVAAMDINDPEATVTPGGVGFDINCGVRMLRSNIHLKELRPLQEKLCDSLFEGIPVGVGGRSKFTLPSGDDGNDDHPSSPLSMDALRQVLKDGMKWSTENGISWPEDSERCEEGGCVEIRNPKNIIKVSQRAEARGLTQLGTLGSGNHYVEVQAVDEIYDEVAAKAMGIEFVGQICIMIHCGSRGLGHQVAKDAIQTIEDPNTDPSHIHIPANDGMLACSKINSPLGQLYLDQMAAASNFAYVNRSVIAQQIRKSFASVFGKDARKDLDMHQIYDVSHNVAKIEKHHVPLAHDLSVSEEKTLLVHRKGATRAFPPNHPDLPSCYREIGQPVLVGGSMGTCSYVLTGTAEGMQKSFGSTCHGAGRALGRHEMKKRLSSEQVLERLKEKNISIRVGNPSSIAEEAPESYKDVVDVVDVCHRNNLSRKAFKLIPICVIKG